MKLYGWVEGGFSGNPDRPHDQRNFGHLFDERANTFLLNQVALVVERPLAPKKGEWDWGFRIFGLYGSDARYTHALGLGDHYGDQLNEADVFDLYLLLHVPIITEGGVDLRIGKFGSLEGAESLDPHLNFFYSHTFIAYFGNPSTHTGILSTIHVTPHLDLYAGVTRGVATAFDDNNDSAGFHGGISLIGVFNGKVDSLLSTHIGPETPRNNHDQRYITDWTTTARMNDRWKSLSDFCFSQDAATGAQCWGVSEQITFKATEQLSFGIRGELFRDPDAFYVAQFGNNTDAMSILRGEPPTSPRTVGGGKTTYGSLTFGFNLKTKPAQLVDLLIRPEIRYDSSLNDTRPFIDSTKAGQWTFGVDFIVSF